MTRGVALVLSLLSLAIVGGLMAMQGKTTGPTATAVTHEESQALIAAASVNFAQVSQVLEAGYAQSGTFLGAQLPLGSGVVLARATGTSYCLQTTVNGSPVHENGPGGSPAAGAC